MECSLTSQRSMEARMPGVSDGSISSKTAFASRIFCSVSKYPTKTAVPFASSTNTWIPVESTPVGGPSSSIRATTSEILSRSQSLNLTTRTYMRSSSSDWAGAKSLPAAWRGQRHSSVPFKMPSYAQGVKDALRKGVCKPTDRNGLTREGTQRQECAGNASKKTCSDTDCHGTRSRACEIDVRGCEVRARARTPDS